VQNATYQSLNCIIIESKIIHKGKVRVNLHWTKLFKLSSMDCFLFQLYWNQTEFSCILDQSLSLITATTNCDSPLILQSTSFSFAVANQTLGILHTTNHRWNTLRSIQINDQVTLQLTNISVTINAIGIKSNLLNSV